MVSLVEWRADDRVANFDFKYISTNEQIRRLAADAGVQFTSFGVADMTQMAKRAESFE